MTARLSRVVLVPGVPALLPEYGGLLDPVTELRAACVAAVRWLGEGGVGIGVHGSHQGLRVAHHLSAEAGVSLDLVSERPARMLLVANGSATRTESAPGHLDDRAAAFDDDVRQALTAEPGRLASLDRDLAAELWADVDSLVWLGAELALDASTVRVDYDDAPYGVQYWVVRWHHATSV